jgi:hypothetical protein
MVTHLTTSPPVRCLNRAERTGSLVFNVLWSYVEENALTHIIYQGGRSDSAQLLLHDKLSCDLNIQPNILWLKL